MTPKQLAFAAAKVRGASNADAATQAGYSARTATEAGARLARNPLILAEITARRAAKGPGVRHTDPLDYLKATMADTGLDMRLRVEAAKALLPYQHAKATGLLPTEPATKQESAPSVFE